MTQKPFAIVSGSGPGFGRHLVGHLNSNGYNAYGLNRSVDPGDEDRMLRVDLSDASHVKSKMKSLFCAHGAPKLVVTILQNWSLHLLMKPVQRTLRQPGKQWYFPRFISLRKSYQPWLATAVEHSLFQGLPPACAGALISALSRQRSPPCGH